jgi:hypothetical protein
MLRSLQKYVMISSDEDIVTSDNYFDLDAAEAKRIMIQTRFLIEDMLKFMKMISLTGSYKNNR